MSLQDRLVNVILFISSLSEYHQPFLVLTTSNALSQWEAEFMRLASSIDIVVYNGNRDTRRSIRTLEFYDEGGGIMLQLLLSTLEIVIEVYSYFSTLVYILLGHKKIRCSLILDFQFI